MPTSDLFTSGFNSIGDYISSVMSKLNPTNTESEETEEMSTLTEEAPTKMKAKEALRQVIELSNWQGDPKDYEGFIEYVKEDNEIAAAHVQFVDSVLNGVAPIEHFYR